MNRYLCKTFVNIGHTFGGCLPDLSVSCPGRARTGRACFRGHTGVTWSPNVCSEHHEEESELPLRWVPGASSIFRGRIVSLQDVLIHIWDDNRRFGCCCLCPEGIDAFREHVGPLRSEGWCGREDDWCQKWQLQLILRLHSATGFSIGNKPGQRLRRVLGPWWGPNSNYNNQILINNQIDFKTECCQFWLINMKTTEFYLNLKVWLVSPDKADFNLTVFTIILIKTEMSVISNYYSLFSWAFKNLFNKDHWQDIKLHHSNLLKKFSKAFLHLMWWNNFSPVHFVVIVGNQKADSFFRILTFLLWMQ